MFVIPWSRSSVRANPADDSASMVATLIQARQSHAVPGHTARILVWPRASEATCMAPDCYDDVLGAVRLQPAAQCLLLLPVGVGLPRGMADGFTPFRRQGQPVRLG